MNLKGLTSFTVGGVLLIYVLHPVVSSALSEQGTPYSSHGPLINSIVLGFAAFPLTGLGLSPITESAYTPKK